MKASLCIEAIGHDLYSKLRLWRGVLGEAGLGREAKAVLGDPSDFSRWGVWEISDTGKIPVYGKTDYTNANSKGSRGVKIFYILESGKKYFVKSPIGWKNIDEYECTVNQKGDIVRY